MSSVMRRCGFDSWFFSRNGLFALLPPEPGMKSVSSLTKAVALVHLSSLEPALASRMEVPAFRAALFSASCACQSS